MKKMMLVGLLMLMSAAAKAAPYVYTPFTQGYKLNYSNGALFDSRFSNPMDFSNFALFYHPLSSGSIIPKSWQTYLPPESWAFNIGGGSGNGITKAGFGPGINLLDSVRGWAAELLASSSNPNLNAAGSQIAPGNGPLSLLVIYEPTSNLVYNGQFAKNPLKFTNHWFIGPSYAF